MDYTAMDQVINWENFSFLSLFGYCCSGVMIFGGIVPYIPQYRDIRRTKNTEGFSLYVCLALLIANTLRILFWYGHPFELPLLIQSVIMNITMLIMIHMYVDIRNKMTIIKEKSRSISDEISGGDSHSSSSSTCRTTSLKVSANQRPRVLWDFDFKYFWDWTDFESYVIFIVGFAFVGGAFVYIFLDFSPFIEFVGFMSVFVEAMLGVPQFYRNFINKSTVGMSKKMVCMWTCGDIYKTTYFVMRSSPSQFWLCGGLQICIDVAILCQALMYRRQPVIRPKPTSTVIKQSKD